MDTHNGKASSANNFPFHNWYNFVLGYSPQFPEYMLERETLGANDLVLDPFMGTGTTLVTCKFHCIPSQGIDANDFMVDAARTKLDWSLDTRLVKQYQDDVLRHVEGEFARYRWGAEEEVTQLSLFAAMHTNVGEQQDIADFVRPRRNKMLLEKYISDRPLARALIIDEVVNQLVSKGAYRDFFDLALTSIIVPISNIRYGPGFGVVKPKQEVSVLELYCERLNRMISDIEATSELQRNTPSDVALGDTRRLTEYFTPSSVSLMMTSPPYPGDHEYTKHTRLELTFRSYATNHEEFRVIKRRMLRASTTNMFKEDNDRETVSDIESIRAVTQLIEERLQEDNATSGFEKLYTRLVWEYFGGMHKSLEQCLRVLKPGGKIALLVSDSHAFKMVHIQSAEILKEIGSRLGYINPEIILWQYKPSTSHKYSLRENVLILTKPT